VAYAITTVHTSGINWESVATIVVSVVVSLSTIFGLIARSMAKYVASHIATSIDRFRIDVVSALADRVASLEASRRRNRGR
jgi:hypothetical protein